MKTKIKLLSTLHEYDDFAEIIRVYLEMEKKKTVRKTFINFLVNGILSSDDCEFAVKEKYDK